MKTEDPRWFAGCVYCSAPRVCSSSPGGDADAQSSPVRGELRVAAENLQITNHGEHDLINYRGAMPDEGSDRIGQPQLPIVVRRFLLPPGSQVSRIQVEVLEADTLQGHYLPRPIQPDPESNSPFAPPDPHTYGQNTGYPELAATITAEGGYRGYRACTVIVYPVQYLPHQRRLVLLERVNLTVETEPMPPEGIARQFKRLRQDHRPWSERPEAHWLEHFVLNPDDHGQYHPPTPIGPGTNTLSVTEQRRFGGFEPTEFPSLEGPPIEYVVITDSVDVFGVPIAGDMVAEFQILADWKTSKGTPAVVRTVSWIRERYLGADTPEKIKAFIKDAASKWGTDYVLLGGDFGVVPPRMLGGVYSDLDSVLYRPDPPADMYYGELDGVWNGDGDAYYGNPSQSGWDTSPREYVDLWVGRLPARTGEEAATQVEKILTYERAPGAWGTPDSDYYDDVLLVAGPTNSIGEYGSNGIYFTETLLAPIFEDSVAVSMDVTRLYAAPPDLVYPCLNENLRCYQVLYNLLSGVTYGHFTAQNFRSELAGGPAFVWHIEHSGREKLGDITIIKDTSCGATSWRDACEQAFKNANPGYAGDLHADMVDRLANSPNYSVVVSGGSMTNMWDLDAVGEHFLRASDGGAVAYFGKTASRVGPAGYTPPLEFFLNVLDRRILHLGEAVGLATNASLAPTGAGVTWPLLGDPELPLWVDTPGQLVLKTAPGNFTALGPQTFTVRLTDSGTAAPVEGARVCLKQGTAAYAVAWTGNDGYAVFPSFTPQTTDKIDVMATARNYKPESGSSRYAAQEPVPAYVAYEEHERDDSGVGGDGDDLVDAGERVALTITSENRGTITASAVVERLWVTSPVVYDLDMEGDDDRSYEPANIHIGSLGAHPHPSWIGDTLHIAAMGDTFRLPANWEGIRPEGQPSPPTAASRFLLWRDTAAQWNLSARRAPGDPDSIFRGVLTTEGGFDSVSWVAETGTTDSVYFNPNVNPDSIWFEFILPPGDDWDHLSFRAEAPNWVTVETDSVELGTIAGGASEEAAFDVSWSTEVPDKDETVFTLAARDGSQNWWFSDFSVSVHAPQVRLCSQRTKLKTEPTYRAFIWPRLSNTGTADANAKVIISNMSGAQFTNLDTLSTIDDLSPLSTARGDSLYLQAYTNFFDALRYDIEVRTYYPNGDSVSWCRSGQDIVPPDPPEDLIVDELGGGAVIRWSAPDDEGVEGYLVFNYVPGDTTCLTLEPLKSATRFETNDRDAFDGSGDYINCRYAVCSVDSSGNKSTYALSDTALVWLPEAAGWPRQMNTGSTCSARAVDMDPKVDGELEILAAGKAIYAWNHDGSPLTSASGIFFDPGTDGTLSVDPDTVHAQFAGALAIADLDGNGLIDVVGNLAPLGIYRIEFDPDADTPVQKRWFRPIQANLKPPMLADLDGEDSLEVIILGDDDSLYVWDCEGRAFADTSTTHGGLFTTQDGATYCYQSVAAGDVRPLVSGTELLVSTWRSGSYLPRVSCYRCTSPVGLLWSTPIGAAGEYLAISGPTIGDVDGDEELEVVVSRRIEEWGASVLTPGGLWVLDGFSGGVEQSIQSDAFRLLANDSSKNPPQPVSLGELRNGDNGLEMVAGGGLYGVIDPAPGQQWPKDVRLHVWSGGTDTTTAIDSLMIPGRKFEDARTVTQTILANLDDDDNIEMLVGMNSAYLACFEWDSAGAVARPERGWPQLFPDLPSTPCIADVDAKGNLEMVVADQSGAVHVLELPGEAAGAQLPWPEYGHDPRSTFNITTARDSGDRQPLNPRGSAALAAKDRVLTIGPSPHRTISWAAFDLPASGPVKLEVFDVQGRFIRRLVDQVLESGSYRIAWDGKSEQGSAAGKGIYLFRLTTNSQSVTRKVSVVE